MIDILYNIFIFPIEMIIEIIYVFAYRVSGSIALSVLGVSLAVSVFTLPLYFMAEKHQHSERDIQKRMKPDVDNIKAVFSGDERFMLLSTYYRQNGYHPLYSLRSSISLIIQIPFFIAAFHFISNLEMIRGVSFGPITDLARPDAILRINGLAINILPILMTLINCLSAFIYGKGLSLREKTQLYGMAVIFLALLYNSPSGMVLYWTGNNLFSLAKNIIQKTRKPKIITSALLLASCSFLIIYMLLFREGALRMRLAVVAVFALIAFLPFIFKFLPRKKQSPLIPVSASESTGNTYIFLFSGVVLFLLSGLVIPSSLIASSVQQFSFIENYESPSPFILNTAMQSFGIFIFWPTCIYFMFSHRTKQMLAKIIAIFACVAMVNAFLFPGNYGYMTLLFTFSGNVSPNATIALSNFIVIVMMIAIVLLLASRLRKVFISLLMISVCALLVTGVVYSVRIHNQFSSFRLQLARNDGIEADAQVFQFSQTGKNVLVIMLDRAVSGFVPFIFEERPDLYNSFDGFTWFRNTISFGMTSIFGIPTAFGGYEYAPLEMQLRNDIRLVDKHNEALLMLPRIFLDHGYKVTVTDPPFANYSWIPDLSIFANHPEINARNIIGEHTIVSWLLSRPYLMTVDLPMVIRANMVRLSFFRLLPVLFRNFFYDNGRWFSAISITPRYSFYGTFLENYAALDILPDITMVTEDRINTFTVLSNNLPQVPLHFLQAPYYTPTADVTYIGSGPFATEKHFHANVASFLLLARWFDFLKENDVYDNTRIIIVSDHGSGRSRGLQSEIPGNIILPNGDSLGEFLALLMVKDFNNRGTLAINNTFMTNADVPLIALEGIVDNPINPWTGRLLASDKSDGVIITTSGLWDPDTRGYTFNIRPNEWLHVHTYVFELENWTWIEK